MVPRNFDVGSATIVLQALKSLPAPGTGHILGQAVLNHLAPRSSGRSLCKILNNHSLPGSTIPFVVSPLYGASTRCQPPPTPAQPNIATQKGINVYAIKGNWRLDGTIQSKIVAMAFSMAAEMQSKTKNGSKSARVASFEPFSLACPGGFEPPAF